MSVSSGPRCVFVSEIPVSYRTGWFRHLHQHAPLDLRVLYLAEGQSDRPWETDSPAATAEEWAAVVPSLDLGSTAGGHFPRLNPRLGRALSEARPDVVVLPGWAHPACWQAAVWCRRHRVPYAVMAETWRPQAETRLPSRATGLVRSAVLRGGALTLPVGSRAAGYLRGLGAPNVHVVHANTCDSAAIVAASDCSSERAPRTVAYVGRLMEHKGAGLLVPLAVALDEHQISLTVVGDGPLRAEIEQLTERGHGVFLGPLPPVEARRVMMQADAVVVPSLKEPWGVVVHEALACGTPVVASTEVGSVDDLITSPLAGTVVAPRVDELTGALVDTVSRVVGRRFAVAEQCQREASSISYAGATDELMRALGSIGLGSSGLGSSGLGSSGLGSIGLAG